jgi:GT2 family glycosyltransferase
MTYKLLNFQDESSKKQDESNKIAVLIPTIGESTLVKVLERTIEELPGAEVVLIGSGTNIGNIAQHYRTCFLEFSEKTWKTVGVNKAVELSRKAWFIILDADAVPQPGWGSAMLELFNQGRSFFTGSVDLRADNYWMRVYNLSLLHEFSTGKPASERKHIPAISMGFTRDFFNQNGPFLENINRSEDYEWSLRAFQKGLAPYYSPKPIIQHIPVNKAKFTDVWRYWYLSGPDNIRIRNLYKETVKTPFFMEWPWFILLFSPLLALVPTLRIFKTSPGEFIKNFDLVPAIYITKIAWCFGVFHYWQENRGKQWK